MLRFTTMIALTIATAAPAFAAPRTVYGEGEGQRFEYTTELRASGIIHIAGTVLGSGEAFVLDVRPNGHVDGAFGGTPVEYEVGKALRNQVAAQLGEGPALASASAGK
jgi:hypothetical protein